MHYEGLETIAQYESQMDILFSMLGLVCSFHMVGGRQRGN